MIKIIFNGKKREILKSEKTLKALIEKKGFKRDLIIIKVNGKYIVYEEMKNCRLKDGDIIETEHVLMTGG
jgi:thiamine biosynthesis protein ThiS